MWKHIEGDFILTIFKTRLQNQGLNVETYEGIFLFKLFLNLDLKNSSQMWKQVRG